MALALSGGAFGALNGYWVCSIMRLSCPRVRADRSPSQGQTGRPDQTLKTFCDSGVEYVTLGFVSRSPEMDTSGAGYPEINFSSHCWATHFDSKGKPTKDRNKLLKDCRSLKKDIPYCRAKGVKVLLSIGGQDDGNEGYKVTTEDKGRSFANFLYDAFGPYREGVEVPRPFGIDAQVDGFDFDIEAEHGKPAHGAATLQTMYPRKK